MTSNIVSRLCEMPKAFKERGVSIAELVRELGPGVRSEISEHDIEAYLREHPDLVASWANHSEDRRSSPSWYLARPGLGLDGKEGWRVGFYAPGNRTPERVFPDEFSACAFFIARYIEQLTR